VGILRDLFGPGTWGAGGNLVAWVICGAIGAVWLRAKLRTHHLALMAQAALHHQERMDQAKVQHNVLVQQAARHQIELLDRADAHHEALKAHVTAAGARVSAGAGSNPAGAGQPATVVPPAAAAPRARKTKVTP
jgi:chorismate synthase